jgi:tyrosine-protein phosphatase 2/3
VRSPSPNYFGLVVEPATDPRDSGAVPREQWSPPTSSVKSFAAAIPKQMPLDANPEFEAFKKQADLNRGKTFSLPTSHLTQSPANPASLRPQVPRWHTHGSDTALERSLARTTAEGSNKDRPESRMDVDQESLHDSAYVSSDSKRNSEASLHASSFFTGAGPRYESPQHMESPFEQRRTTISKIDDRHPRLSIMHNKADPPSPDPQKPLRSETVPPKLENGPSWIGSDELTVIIGQSSADGGLLLLDLRGSQQYAQSRIEGALNLCIPTTLLKRPMYNIQRLQKTFNVPADQERFARWRSVKYLVVYDSFSSEKHEAVSCMNMIRKFTNEGFNGSTCILRGGFDSFKDTHPGLIDDTTGPEVSGSSPFMTNQDGSRSNLPPVIGGVALPRAANTSNPFFANIRQNMDLADGVGQMDISRPPGLESPTLPRWLRDASTNVDHGKQVSDKFLSIERQEQSRMKSAFSMFGPGNQQKEDNPQLCGIEKGIKNRYKDILPFEQTRVKLHGKQDGDCDYVNASHIKASRSNKRYIATQGPLPATFEVCTPDPGFLVCFYMLTFAPGLLVCYLGPRC